MKFSTARGCEWQQPAQVKQTGSTGVPRNSCCPPEPNLVIMPSIKNDKPGKTHWILLNRMVALRAVKFYHSVVQIATGMAHMKTSINAGKMTHHKFKSHGQSIMATFFQTVWVHVILFETLIKLLDLSGTWMCKNGSCISNHLLPASNHHPSGKCHDPSKEVLGDATGAPPHDRSV